jgi:hypothetical protein
MAERYFLFFIAKKDGNNSRISFSPKNRNKKRKELTNL